MFKSILNKEIGSAPFIDVAKFISYLHTNDPLIETYMTKIALWFEKAITETPELYDYIVADTVYSVSKVFYSKDIMELEYIDETINICNGIMVSTEVPYLTLMVNQCGTILTLVLSEAHVLTSKIDDALESLKQMDTSILSMAIARLLLNIYIRKSDFNWNEEAIDYLVDKLSNVSDDQEKLLMRFLSSL